MRPQRQRASSQPTAKATISATPTYHRRRRPCRRVAARASRSSPILRDARGPTGIPVRAAATASAPAGVFRHADGFPLPAISTLPCVVHSFMVSSGAPIIATLPPASTSFANGDPRRSRIGAGGRRRSRQRGRRAPRSRRRGCRSGRRRAWYAGIPGELRSRARRATRRGRTAARAVAGRPGPGRRDRAGASSHAPVAVADDGAGRPDRVAERADQVVRPADHPPDPADGGVDHDDVARRDAEAGEVTGAPRA